MSSPTHAKKHRHLWKIAGSFMAAVLLVTLNLQATRRLPQVQISEEERVAHAWSPDLIRLISGGHTPVVVDLLLIRFLLDDSMRKAEAGRHAPLFYDLDLATQLDPQFMQIALYGAILLTVVRDDHQGALVLLERAERYRRTELRLASEEFRLEHWPEPWRIPFMRGYVSLFELRDYALAAESFSQLEAYPEASLFHGMARKLRTRSGLIEVAGNSLDRLIEMEKDETRRRILIQRREEVRIEAYLDQLSRRLQAYEQTHARALRRPEGFSLFLKAEGLSGQDPWGGTLSIGPQGRLETSTPREVRF